MQDERVTRGLPAMHPGELLREDVLPAFRRTRAEIARLLGVSLRTLKRRWQDARLRLMDWLGDDLPW